LPWLLLGIERASESSVACVGCGWLTIAISIALSIYAGFPETAYIDGLLAVVWSFWRMANVQAEFRCRFIIKLATGVVVGLLLSAPIIIPFAEFITHSYVGLHSIGFSGLIKDALPILFFLWLYGGICTSSDVFFIQSNVGGFLGATQDSSGAIQNYFFLYAHARTRNCRIASAWSLLAGLRNNTKSNTVR
jgi:hypothetical protein